MFIDVAAHNSLIAQLEKFKGLFDFEATDSEQCIGDCKKAIHRIDFESMSFDLAGESISVPEVTSEIWMVGNDNYEVRLRIGDSNIYYYYTNLAEMPSNCYSFVRHVLHSFEKKHCLQYNCAQLGDFVNSVLQNEDCPYTVEFAHSRTLFNLTNTHLGIGLSESVISELHKLINPDAMTCNNMIRGIKEAFMSLPCILEIFHRRTVFTVKLGIYTRKSIRTLVRQAYHRQIGTLHNGIGYFENNGLFSLVQLWTCTDAELQELKQQYGNKLVVNTNKNPKTCDIWLADTDADLDKLKARCENKNLTYDISEWNGKKCVVYRRHTAFVIQFGPINLSTYEVYKQLNSEVASMLDF